MKKTKKVNPRNRPVSQADLEKAQDKACHLAMAIFITVLKDRFGFDNNAIIEAWDASDKLSQEIKEGRIKIQDLLNVLSEEYDISVVI